MTQNKLVADVIWLFHLGVVIFVIITPFLKYSSLYLLHIVFCFSLLVHWWNNNNVCSLSVLESQLRGLDYTQSFTHKFIGPVYDVSKTEWANVTSYATIGLMIFSIYRLYNSPNFDKMIHCWKSTSDMPIKYRLTKCTMYLFQSDI